MTGTVLHEFIPESNLYIIIKGYILISSEAEPFQYYNCLICCSFIPGLLYHTRLDTLAEEMLLKMIREAGDRGGGGNGGEIQAIQLGDGRG